MYERLNPLFQELCEVYEGASPATQNRVCGELRRLVHEERRRKRALGELDGGGAGGKNVSGKVARDNASRKRHLI